MLFIKINWIEIFDLVFISVHATILISFLMCIKFLLKAYFLYVHTQTYVHTIHTNIHIYIHTYTHTHIHIYIQYIHSINPVTSSPFVCSA